jgi:hypothetical protein
MSLQIMDRKRRFQRLGVTPFEAVPTPGLPFTYHGMEWCASCNEAVDVDTMAVKKGTLYLYKKLCKRCGEVLMRGVYDKTSAPVPRVAFGWLNKKGEDRS